MMRISRPTMSLHDRFQRMINTLMDGQPLVFTKNGSAKCVMTQLDGWDGASKRSQSVSNSASQATTQVAATEQHDNLKWRRTHG
ncbi:hypothetical protein [Levilactobacillus humaensis]|uniref:hypothetical protein n=1 Tax=Levilactobacillus humaensis TaxID=2950375 RepID=UPI0021C2DEF4|nr:hypothetical protein [Levilactobacillus humaensis]